LYELAPAYDVQLTLILLVRPDAIVVDATVPGTSTPLGSTAVTSYEYGPAANVPPDDAVSAAAGTAGELNRELDTRALPHVTPVAEPHAPTYRRSAYGWLLPAPEGGTHQVAVVDVVLATFAPDRYGPPVPPVQLVNCVDEVGPAHVIVPDEPMEIVFEPELNPSVLATVIVPAGSAAIVPFSVAVGAVRQ
jgi:hypothetical protein